MHYVLKLTEHLQTSSKPLLTFTIPPYGHCPPHGSPGQRLFKTFLSTLGMELIDPKLETQHAKYFMYHSLPPGSCFKTVVLSDFIEDAIANGKKRLLDWASDLTLAPTIREKILSHFGISKETCGKMRDRVTIISRGDRKTTNEWQLRKEALHAGYYAHLVRFEDMSVRHQVWELLLLHRPSPYRCLTCLYCREPPPKGLRGYGGGRTDKWRAQ